MKNLFNIINYIKILKQKKRADTFGFHEERYTNNILKTKYNESVLVSYPSDLSDDIITIYLTSFIKGKYHRAYMYLNFKDKVMDISDIGVLKKEAKSRGYGDLLMETALGIARLKGASIATGKMVFDSLEQRERQINYYSKHGFQIDESYNLKLVL